LSKEPATGAALWRELQDAPVDQALLQSPRGPLNGGASVPEAAARSFVESLALALQASVLHKAGSPIAAAFHESRVATPHAGAFGTLPDGLPLDGILERDRKSVVEGKK